MDLEFELDKRLNGCKNVTFDVSRKGLSIGILVLDEQYGSVDKSCMTLHNGFVVRASKKMV